MLAGGSAALRVVCRRPQNIAAVLRPKFIRMAILLAFVNLAYTFSVQTSIEAQARAFIQIDGVPVDIRDFVLRTPSQLLQEVRR